MLLNLEMLNNNLKYLEFIGGNSRSTTKLFTIASKDNKQKVEELLSRVFSGVVIDYEVKKFLELNDNNTFLLNKKINDELLTYFKDKGYMGIYPYLKDFAKSNYFELKSGEIGFRDLRVNFSDVATMVERYANRNNKFNGISNVNYDAIVTSNGDIYLANTMHDNLIPYMIAKSIDLSKCVRISYVPYQQRHYGNNLIFSSLYPYRNQYAYASQDEMNEDKSLYLSRSIIRILCEYARASYPDLSKEKMLKLFQFSENLGYDFMSKLNKKDILNSYDIAIENLEHIHSIIDDMFPDEYCDLNLVDAYKSRIRGLHLSIVD